MEFLNIFNKYNCIDKKFSLESFPRFILVHYFNRTLKFFSKISLPTLDLK